jgi:uncharacterized membrane protein YraQ (UPF0718 family)
VNDLELILQKAAAATWNLVPYVVVGVLAGEALRYTSAGRLLERARSRQPAVGILVAAPLGVASPFCTYGTVPLVLELLRAGLPVAPLATFLATSSLMNPQLFLITWGGLGPSMALARLAAVLGFGVLLGAVLHFLPKPWTLQPVLARLPQPAHRHTRRFTWKGFLVSSWAMLEFVGFYVLLGILLGVAVEVLVPGRWILLAFGSGGWHEILLAALLGVPLYACGGGTIPLVQSLLNQGMAAGAALAFLIAGPATRITPLVALASLLRPSFIVAYVASLILYSVLVGLAYGLY